MKWQRNNVNKKQLRDGKKKIERDKKRKILQFKSLKRKEENHLQLNQKTLKKHRLKWNKEKKFSFKKLVLGKYSRLRLEQELYG